MVKFYRLNDRIQSSTLRVIGIDGKQLGIISRDEALSKAKEEGLDLVEVATNASPPIARIVDFEKFRYQEAKKERAAKKNVHEVELKEVWLSPRIAQHDLEVRIKKAESFLESGNKVKLTVKFRGREMAHPENGHQVLKQALTILGNRVNIEREIKFEGRNLTTIIGINKRKEETNSNQI